MDGLEFRINHLMVERVLELTRLGLERIFRNDAKNSDDW